jgi:hypothetical protein
MTYPPLLSYSDTQDRATLIHLEEDEESQPPAFEMKKKQQRSKGGSRKKFTVNNGRIALRIPGYSGMQHLPVSKLIVHMPMKKLKIAAKKVLREKGVQKKRIRKRKKKNNQ